MLSWFVVFLESKAFGTRTNDNLSFGIGILLKKRASFVDPVAQNVIITVSEKWNGLGKESRAEEDNDQDKYRCKFISNARSCK